MKTLIRGGKVCFEDKIGLADILIIDEKIVAIGNLNGDLGSGIDQVIDASNLFVLPGAIDLHVHVDDQIGDYYLADTYQTATTAAIMNGVTTIASFITQNQNSTLAAAIEAAEHKAKNHSHCDYLWHLTPTSWDELCWQELFAAFDRGFKSLKLYTTYKPAGIYSSYEEIAAILKKIQPYDVTALIHCEDDNLLATIAAESTFDLADAYSLSLLRPQAVEVVAIEKIIDLAKTTAAKVHMVHVSTPEGAEKIFHAKQDLAITCETCPQYLFVNDEVLRQADGYRYTCTPPLRDPKAQLELQKLALQGYIDVYATDHCAFAKKAKDTFTAGGNILTVPKGMPGLGALLPMIYKLYESQGDAGLVAMMQKLALNPAKVAGIYPRKGSIKVNADADLVLLNPHGAVRAIFSTLSDVYDPFAEFSTNLDLKYVFLRGKMVLKDNKFISNNNPEGISLC